MPGVYTYPWTGSEPALIARLYANAAAIITDRGYYGGMPSEVPGEPVSLLIAVELAVRAELGGEYAAEGDVELLAEEALARLGGVILLTGQRCSPGAQYSSAPVVDAWDDDHRGRNAGMKDQALALLEMAGILIGAAAAHDMACAE